MSLSHAEKMRGTHLQPQDKLSEQWPWNREFLRLALIIPAVAGFLAAAVLYPFFGVYSLYFLLAIPSGLLFRVMYGVVGARVEALRRAAATRGGEVAEGLLVVGRIECPGLVVMGESELVLMPIVGNEVTVPLDTITVVREGRWLPGKFVWGKRAFNLGTTTSTRLAFAVSKSIAKKWSPRLGAR